MVELSLSDKIILASPSKDVKPFEVIGKEYVREAVKRLKDNEKELWNVLAKLIIKEYAEFMPEISKCKTLNNLFGKNIEDYLKIDEIFGEKLC